MGRTVEVGHGPRMACFTGLNSEPGLLCLPVCATYSTPSREQGCASKSLSREHSPGAGDPEAKGSRSSVRQPRDLGKVTAPVGGGGGAGFLLRKVTSR